MDRPIGAPDTQFVQLPTPQIRGHLLSLLTAPLQFVLQNPTSDASIYAPKQVVSATPQPESHLKPDQNLMPTHKQCYDWLVIGGPYHWARNYSFFTTYREIKATVNGIPVIGIGTAVIEVQTSPQASDTRKLILRNVLHIPTITCNGFSHAQFYPATKTRKIGEGIQGFNTRGSDLPAVPLWYATELKDVHPGRLVLRLLLVGDPQGVSYIKDGPKNLSMDLSEEEKRKLQAVCEH